MGVSVRGIVAQKQMNLFGCDIFLFLEMAMVLSTLTCSAKMDSTISR